MKAALSFLIAPLHRSKLTLVTALLMVCLAVFLCTVNGFNILNYYSALALGIVGGVLGGLAGIGAGREATRRGRWPFWPAFVATLWLSVPATLILGLNGFRVTTCDPLEGLAFHAMGPGLSIAFGSQVGALCAMVSQRLRWAIPLFVACWLGAALWDVLHIYQHPAVFVFNPYAGYFSGAIYDTAIHVDARFLLYRLANLAQLGVIWGIAWLAWMPFARRFSVTAVRAASLPAWSLVAVSVVTAAALFGSRAEIGYEVSEADIRAELGGEVSNDRLTLVYDRQTIGDAEAAALLEDHTFRLEQLDTEVGRVFSHRITSFVYANAAQKRRMMGAGRSYLAKPWSKQIHLNRVGYGHSVIKHELSHVVLGQFASAPFHVPTAWCVFPQATVVEGAAESFEWDTGALTPHQWSAAMRREGIAPPLAGLLGPSGFYNQSSRKAYTLSGSFIRWLRDTRGAAAFRDVYRDADFGRAYPETTLAALAEAWGTFVDAQTLPPDALALAAERFHRKAIFSRVCPLEVARLEAEARGLARAGDVDQAISLYRDIIAFVPDDPAKRVPIMQLQARDGRAVAGAATLADYRAMDGRNPATDALMGEMMADAQWRSGDVAGAAAAYVGLSVVPQSEDRRRNVMVKAEVAASEALEPILGPFLMDGTSEGALDYLFEAVADLPGDPLASYLLGRRLIQKGRHAEGVKVLGRASTLLNAVTPPPIWQPWIERETWRMLGHSHFKLGELDAATDAFGRFVALTPWDGLRSRYEDWLARIRWKAARAPK
ncbi:MAG: tetratricopeptide (TPR) repeat protein [Myxococcota bacterium]|jgi:tetratricopeptide (TPR) repeat protein